MNLLPQQEQSRIRKEYYARLVIVMLFGVAAAVAVALVVLVPVYVSLFAKEKSAAAETEALQSALAKEDGTVRAALESFRKEFAMLSLTDEGRATTLITRALDKKGNDITVTSVVYDKRGAEESLALGGTASTRAALLLFQKALEGEYVFDHVNIPVSNFVRESDIPFTIAVTVRKTTD